MLFFLLALATLIIPFIGKAIWPGKFTLKEMLVACIAPVLVVSIIYIGGSYSEMADTLLINGQVTDKKREEVHCRHSYDCNCYYSTRTWHDKTGTHTSRTKHCSTCYYHLYDVDWNVYSNISDTTSIDKLDRQGLQEPPRWTQVIIGEPYSKTESYQNYVKGSKASLFNLEKYTKAEYAAIPDEPIGIHDYYRSTHAVDMGTGVKNLSQLDAAMADVSAKLGPTKQVNVVMAFTPKSMDYAYAIRNKWLGGKKNDVLIIIGTKTWPTVDWVQVFSWSKNEMVNIKIRDDIMGVGTLADANVIGQIVATDVSANFVRREMKEFEYLKNEIEPSIECIWLALGLGMLVSLGLTIWFRNEDVM